MKPGARGAPALAAALVATLLDPAQRAPLAYISGTLGVLIGADLMRLNLIGTVIFSISGLVMASLQANQHFFLPALAPIMYNLGILFGVIFLAPTLGVWGPTIGVVIGSVLHLLIQVPGLIKYKATWTAWLGWRDSKFV
mgnify:CR=1 FL=1